MSGKRIGDRRKAIPLAYCGDSRFHMTSDDNRAELARTVLERPATGLLIASDPRTLTVAEIGAV